MKKAASVIHHLSSFQKPFMSLFQENGFELDVNGSKDELLEMEIVCDEVNFIKSPIAIDILK